MPFFVNNTGWAGAGTPPAKTGGCGCGCDGRGADPAQGADLVQAMRGLVLNSKIDAALGDHAPITTNAKGGKPLMPRGVLGGERHSAPESATQGRVAAQGHAPAKTTPKATATAPLRPRGVLGKRGN